MHKNQTPRGPDDLNCPLHKKAMSEVCHKCPWWTRLEKKDAPDEWDCAIAWQPRLMVLNAQEQHLTAHNVDKMTAEMQKTDKESTATIALLTTMLNRVTGHAPALQDERQMPLRLEN